MTVTVILLFPVEMRNEDTEPRRESDEEIDHDGQDKARRADSGERLRAEHLSDEGGVSDGVELLEQLREEYRQHEDEQLPHNRPAREVLLIRAVKEQNVQMMQIVMQKIIGERIAYDALAAFEGVELAEHFFHNEILKI